MKLVIPIKPLSINDAHYGRHIKTAEFKQYEVDVFKTVPYNTKKIIEGEIFIKYIFYIKNYKKSDTGNFEKLITDLLVKLEYLKDDRFIKAFYLQKEAVDFYEDERIEVNIISYKDRKKLL